MIYRLTFYSGPVSCPTCLSRLDKRRVLHIIEATVTPKRHLTRAVTDSILSALERGQTIEIERVHV